MPSARSRGSPGKSSARMRSPMAARRSQNERQARARASTSSSRPSVAPLAHEDRGRLRRDLRRRRRLARREALAALAARVATHDVDRDAERRASLQRHRQRDGHPARARHQRGDAEHLVERAPRARRRRRGRAIRRAAAERAPRAHLDRRRRRCPGGGSFGRWIHSIGGACGLSRPEPAWIMLSTRPSAMAHQEERWSRRRARQPFGDRRRVVGRGRDASASSTSVITTASTSSRVAATSSNDDAGIAAGSGSAVAEQLGDPGGGDRGCVGCVHRVPFIRR